MVRPEREASTPPADATGSPGGGQPDHDREPDRVGDRDQDGRVGACRRRRGAGAGARSAAIEARVEVGVTGVAATVDPVMGSDSSACGGPRAGATTLRSVGRPEVAVGPLAAAAGSADGMPAACDGSLVGRTRTPSTTYAVKLPDAAVAAVT